MTKRPATSDPDKGEIRGTVARVVRLLQRLAESNELSLKELSQELSLPPSTLHRLLQLLMQHDLVERSAKGRGYQSGLEFFRLASLVVNKTDIADVADPFMRAVVAACNEVCFLVLYLPTIRRVMIVKSIDSQHPLRYNITLNQPDTVLWGATGRSVLAFLPPAEVDAALAEATPSPVTGRSLGPRKRFLDELAAIRRAGYVCTRGQKMPGAVGLGAPLFSRDGDVIGSLCVTVPQSRFDPKSETRLAELVMTHAKRLSSTLGYRDPSGKRNGATRA